MFLNEDFVGEGVDDGTQFGGFETEVMDDVALVCVGCVSSSNGKTTGGLGKAFGFGGATFWSALLTSVRRASNSRSNCFSYMIDERACSTKAAVISSATARLCVSNA